MVIIKVDVARMHGVQHVAFAVRDDGHAMMFECNGPMDKVDEEKLIAIANSESAYFCISPTELAHFLAQESIRLL